MGKLCTIVVTAVALLFPFTMDSQTRWFKYEGNPVLDVGPAGSWDEPTVLAGPVLHQDSVYRMWYSSWGGPAARIGLATSRDGITWVKDPLNPLLGPTLLWESNLVVLPSVIFSGSQYKMWYIGNLSTGYACSPDGRTTWVKNVFPVLWPGPAAWDAVAANGVSVLDTVGGFKMWYTGFRGGNLGQIGYATGSSESTWTKYAGNPVLGYGSPGSWEDRQVGYPYVLHEDGIYHMWYMGSRSGVYNSQVGYASSPDGIHWTKDASNPVLKPSPVGFWDVGSVIAEGVTFDGSLYHMWYSGYDGTKFRIGYAVSPKGLQTAILPSRDVGWSDTVTVRVSVDNLSPGLSFFAQIVTPEGQLAKEMELFDSGVDGDSLAGDGIFANRWTAPDTNRLYYVDYEVRLHDTLRFGKIRETLTVPVSPDRHTSLPVRFELEQNFPNPFNPTTALRYQLPVASDVKLTVYDILGREVSLLVNDRQGPGAHEVTFDAAGLPSGVYLYKLQAGSYTSTRKALLLK